MSQIPLCHKCIQAITAPSKDMKGAYILVGCKTDENIVTFDDAKRLCPIIEHEAEQPAGKVVYNIQRIPTPEGCEGTWYEFATVDHPQGLSKGRAREDMLHLYVGRKAARAAIEALGQIE